MFTAAPYFTNNLITSPRPYLTAKKIAVHPIRPTHDHK